MSQIKAVSIQQPGLALEVKISKTLSFLSNPISICHFTKIQNEV